jgi:hypothetical protein
MDNVTRFIDCLDEAYGQTPSSMSRIKEIKSLANAQMMELLKENVRLVFEFHNMEPDFIPANPKVAIIRK